MRAALERPLPESLPVGRATALYLAGTCFDDAQALRGLDVLLDAERYPVGAFGMARPDVARVHGRAAARSGFWTIVPLAARAWPGSLRVALAAQLADGAVEEIELGRIEIAAPAPSATSSATPAPRAAPGPGLIAVCMATFEPDMELFRAQIGSLRTQSDQNWFCVISDDASSPERFAHIEAELAGDPRFAVSRSSQRLGFYRNFERALSLAPSGADLIALCDQDDRWHSDKLAALRAGLGDAGLVYSDMRLVEADGRVLRETLWRGRSNNHTDLAAMLVANTITGAAILFTRELLELSLPFPDTPGFQFHDHWLAVVALAAGEVAYVPRPLYDYVQHRGAVFGHVTHGERTQPAGGRLARQRRRLEALPLSSRAAYFYGYLPRASQAHVLLARLGPTMAPAKRRVLQRYLAAERSWAALLWLALRGLRPLVGRTETLASELELVRGVLWRRLAAVGGRGLFPAVDATPPPPDAFSQKRLRRWRAAL